MLYLLCHCRADADVDGCKGIVKNLDIASEAAVTDVECLAVCAGNCVTIQVTTAFRLSKSYGRQHGSLIGPEEGE
jgi:hypothetical protein